jgi:elongation factor G
MGELHLEVIQHRLEQEFRVRCTVGEPRVAYRETVRGPARAIAEVERVLGGKDVFGAVGLEVEPAAEVERVEVGWADDVPLRTDAQSGPRFGFPLVHVRVRVTGGRSEARRDSEAAFAEAAAKALREALQRGGVDVLEPWMELEVQTREAFASGILADLNARRAEVGEVSMDGELRTIRATVALSRMFGYASALRSLSQGQAAFSMSPADHRRVPEGELVERGVVWG